MENSLVLNIPPRMKVFTWKLCHGALPTRYNLKKQIRNFSMECAIYCYTAELKVHVLLHCSLATLIWEDSNWQHQFWKEHFRTMWECFECALRVCDHEELGQFVAIVWKCWNARNRLFCLTIV